jgi:hypothetical protein
VRAWRDRDGRCWAQRLSGYRADVPTDEDITRWKAETIPANEGGREIF